MTINELVQKLELTKLTEAGDDKEVKGVCIGDLLSVVMTKCEADAAWITVQTHPNILSVADLNDAACIIVCGGTKVDRSLTQKAEEMGVSMLSTDMEAYELAWKLHEVI